MSSTMMTILAKEAWSENYVIEKFNFHENTIQIIQISISKNQTAFPYLFSQTKNIEKIGLNFLGYSIFILFWYSLDLKVIDR